MSVIMVAFLMIGKMPLFDSLLLMFGSAGTGGFSILNTGCATYTPYVQYVIAIFMMLFGINFNVYYFLLIRKFKEAVKYEELRYYLLFIAASTLLIVINIHNTFDALEPTFRHAFFQVSSHYHNDRIQFH